MKNRVKASVSAVALSALLLGGAYTGPAIAASTGPAAVNVEAASEVATDSLRAAPGSLFYQVDHASTEGEKVALLESAGFTRTEELGDGLAYEKTEGGITLGYAVTNPVVFGKDDSAGTDARVGVDRNGAYVAATLSEWKKMLAEGSLYAGAGCVFITMAIGAFACAAAAVYVSSRINEIDTRGKGGHCYALYSGKRFIWKPGAC